MNVTLHSTLLEGVYVVEVPIFRDTRGFLFESYHQRKFAELGLTANFVQDNHSRSTRGVLRGLHFQDTTAPMGKLVRCTLGAVFDVAVDLRVGSPTFGRWFGVELTADNVKQLWVPAGFAHGFVALTEAAELQYKCTNFYAPASEGAVAWNDPDLAIEWPIADPIISPRDRQAMSLKQYLQKPAFRYPVSE
jgi:dTDP-4-dehydrorhamnose 3,5-epimerase